MAAIKVWVRTDGDDAKDGLSYANAKETLEAGLTALNGGTKGSILNIVASGNHKWSTVGNEVDINNAGGNGTNFTTDWGYLIRGVDGADENPAMATIVPDDTDGDVVRRLVRFRNPTAYHIIENLIFDSSGRASDTNIYTAIRCRDNGTGPVLIRYCANIGGPTGTVSAAKRSLFEVDSTGSSIETFRILYCYFQNCHTPLSGPGYGGALLKTTIDHCVGIWDANGRAAAWYNQGSWGSETVNNVIFTNNTFYEDVDNNTPFDIFTYYPTTDSWNIGTVSCYNNLVWWETKQNLSNFMGGTAAVPNTIHTGVVNNNILLGGPSVTSGDIDATAGWYQIPWDANDDDAVDPDTWPEDTVFYEQADTDVFNDPDSTYDWELPNGLTITILKDLRPIKYTTGGRYGTVPGALPLIAEDDPDDPDSSAAVPYIDTYPLYATVLEIFYNAWIKTDVNRVEDNYLWEAIENKKFREFAAKRLTIATNMTTNVGIGGIEEASFLLLESDSPVDVSIGNQTNLFWPSVKMVALAEGDFSVMQIRNQSTTTEANVLVLAVD